MAQGTCTIDGCEGVRHGRGLCSRHYFRARVNGGNPLPDKPFRVWGRPCRVEGCERKPHGSGLCNAHRQRLASYGDVIAERPVVERVPADEAFWTHVLKTDGCWLWQAALDASGYGRSDWSGGSLAHRRAYTMLVGPIPDGLTLDHLCRVRACVRPDHLEPVTQAENNRRMNATRKVGVVS